MRSRAERTRSRVSMVFMVAGTGGLRLSSALGRPAPRTSRRRARTQGSRAVTVARPALLLGGLALLAGLAASAEEKAPEKFMVYVGTYTGGKGGSEGIYRLELDLATGKLSEPALAARTANPSFLAVHPTGKFLYAVGEAGKAQGVNAFAIDQKTGDLTFLNGRSSGGAAPCHVSLDSKGRYAFAANY